MSRALHCDNPECETWQRISDGHLEYPPHANWINVEVLNRDGELHFCSWRCVQAFAGQKTAAGLVSSDTTTKVPRPRNAPRIRVQP